MLYTVLKPFKTPRRRFRAGQEVAASEIDGDLTTEQWEAKGFLRAPRPAPAADLPPPVPAAGQDQPEDEAEATTGRKGKRTAS